MPHPVTQAVAVRAALGVTPSTPLVVYTGTFEAYQGLDLLFAAAALVVEARPDARFLLAGGRPEQVDAARAQASAQGLGTAVIFAGERPSAEIPGILEAADVLVSPRSRGTNTPLKIYQYLRSGRAIVATRLLTHTQVLDDSVAILTGVSPREFADGILAALADPQMAATIGARAAALAATEVQLRRVSGTDTRGRGAPHERRPRPGGWRRRVTPGTGPRASAPPDHYSYTAYADPAMADRFEQVRFGGPIGGLLAESQERVLVGFVGPLDGRTVLDVGTGTGRAALALAARGGTVTGVDASTEMLRVAPRACGGARRAGCVHAWRRTRPSVRGGSVRRGGVPPGADAHARLGPVRR